MAYRQIHQGLRNRVDHKLRDVTIRLAAVVGDYVGLLPQMLDHYLDLGVTSIHLAVHLDPERKNNEVLERVHSAIRELPVVVEQIIESPWHESVNCTALQQIRNKFRGDWFVLADQDEFQQYPKPVQEIVLEAEQRGWDYITGCLLDRVASDGSLKAPTPHGSVWQDFPLVGFFSLPALRAFPRKVCLCKSHTVVTHGQHSADGVRCPPQIIFVPVHHFKWVSGIESRLRERVKNYTSGKCHLIHPNSPDESARFISLLDIHERIPVSESNYSFELCRNPHDLPTWWPKVVKLMENGALTYDKWRQFSESA